MALGRAHKGLGQAEAAAAAFQRVLMLDSTHAEATWALRQMEFELGRNLLEPGGL
jgi:Ser/Thr protein kinase RdoA (MazF antagonist)